MKKLDPNWMRDWPGNKRFAGIGVLVLAATGGLAGWYVRAHASAPAQTTSKPAAVPLLWTLPPSAYAGPRASVQPGEAGMDAREAALRWTKAGKEVEMRQHALEKARADYLRIRRELAKAGLSDDYIQLARQRVEEAAEALQEAKLNRDLSWFAYRASQETEGNESGLKSASR